MNKPLTILALPILAVGMATSATAAEPADSARDAARDHAAILGMQGEHVVSFAFDETVLLQPGYERHPAKRSGGNETVTWWRIRRPTWSCSTSWSTRRAAT